MLRTSGASRDILLGWDPSPSPVSRQDKEEAPGQTFREPVGQAVSVDHSTSQFLTDSHYSHLECFTKKEKKKKDAESLVSFLIDSFGIRREAGMRPG